MSAPITKNDDPKLLLPWYVNGTLSAAERLAVEEHLHDCASCREALRDLQRISDAVAEEQAVPLIPEPPVDDFLKVASTEKQKTRTISKLHWFAAAATVVLLIAAGYLGQFLLPNNNVFRTVTDPSNSAEISYIFDIAAEPANKDRIRNAIDEAFAGNQLSVHDNGFRLTISMPSVTMTELDEYAEVLRQIDGVQRVDIVGVQLPLE